MKKHKNIFTFSLHSCCSDDVDGCYNSLWIWASIILSYAIKSMAADALATHGARTSGAMVSILFSTATFCFLIQCNASANNDLKKKVCLWDNIVSKQSVRFFPDTKILWVKGLGSMWIRVLNTLISCHHNTSNQIAAPRGPFHERFFRRFFQFDWKLVLV